MESFDAESYLEQLKILISHILWVGSPLLAHPDDGTRCLNGWLIKNTDKNVENQVSVLEFKIFNFIKISTKINQIPPFTTKFFLFATLNHYSILDL